MLLQCHVARADRTSSTGMQGAEVRCSNSIRVERHVLSGLDPIFAFFTDDDGQDRQLWIEAVPQHRAAGSASRFGSVLTGDARSMGLRSPSTSRRRRYSSLSISPLANRLARISPAGSPGSARAGSTLPKDCHNATTPARMSVPKTSIKSIVTSIVTSHSVVRSRQRAGCLSGRIFLDIR
jgi:hypothetical protein